MIIYIENPRESTKNFQELISKNIISVIINNKVTGYKINIQKSNALVYTDNEKMETKIKTQYHNNCPKNRGNT